MVVPIVLCGYSVGGILAPLLGILLMPNSGWQSIFWFAGLPLLLLPFIHKHLPETASYLIRKGKKEKLLSTLAKLSPELNFNQNDEFNEQKTVPVLLLFDK